MCLTSTPNCQWHSANSGNCPLSRLTLPPSPISLELGTLATELANHAPHCQAKWGTLESLALQHSRRRPPAKSEQPQEVIWCIFDRLTSYSSRRVAPARYTGPPGGCPRREAFAQPCLGLPLRYFILFIQVHHMLNRTHPRRALQRRCSSGGRTAQSCPGLHRSRTRCTPRKPTSGTSHSANLGLPGGSVFLKL